MLPAKNDNTVQYFFSYTSPSRLVDATESANPGKLDLISQLDPTPTAFFQVLKNQGPSWENFFFFSNTNKGTSREWSHA